MIKENSIRTIHVRLLNLKYHKFRYVSIALLVLSTVLILSTRTLPVQKKCTIIIMNGRNQPVILKAELALTDRERARGLMFRKKLGSNEGMLFVFATARYRNFWMKNTFLPLSIAYISKYGTINEIYDMKPLDTSRTYPSRRPAQYALEVNRGWFQRNNITRGCKVLLNGCIGQ